MCKGIAFLVFSLVVIAVIGCSYQKDSCPETFELADDIGVEMEGAKTQWACNCRVTMEPDDNRWQFLLTFHIEPYNDIDPVFYMTEQIATGAGLKIQKIFPCDEVEIAMCDSISEIDDTGRLIKISSIQSPHLPYFFNGRDGRKVVFQQRVSLQDRFPSDEGLYAVTYEHPWDDIEGTNVRFTSDKLLVCVSSSKRRGELLSLFKGNPLLELASYQMKHPSNSEFAKYGRPLKYFDQYLKEGMLCDEVLFLMGSPDYSDRDNRHWGYETSPVGGFYIFFEDGKVARKGFSFERS